jgi:hypothetical protein
MDKKKQSDFNSEDQAGYIWFKFFPNDWLTDPVVNRMSASEQGTYIWLLCQQWIGVHPRTLRSSVLLSRFVGPRPIALSIPPETREGERQFRRRLGLGE